MPFIISKKKKNKRKRSVNLKRLIGCFSIKKFGRKTFNLPFGFLYNIRKDFFQLRKDDGKEKIIFVSPDDLWSSK